MCEGLGCWLCPPTMSVSGTELREGSGLVASSFANTEPSHWPTPSMHSVLRLFSMQMAGHSGGFPFYDMPHSVPLEKAGPAQFL